MHPENPGKLSSRVFRTYVEGRFDGDAGSRRAEGGVGVNGRFLEWSMGSRIGRRRGKHDHFRPDFHPLIKVRYVLVGQPNTAGRNPLPDRVGLVGAVNSIFGLAQIHRPSAEWIAGPARHKPRQVGLTRKHVCRRTPIRPLCFPGNHLFTRPCEALAANADSVAHRLPRIEDKIKKCVSGIDDDGAWRLVADVVNDLSNKSSRNITGFLDFDLRCRELEPELKRELELVVSEAGPDARRAFAPVERSPDAIANRTPMRQRLWRRPQLFRPPGVRVSLYFRAWYFHAWPACS